MSMYRNLQAFARDRKKLELYDIVDYIHLHRCITFPITILEIERVARRYPVVWQRSREAVELVALVGLEPGRSDLLRNAAALAEMLVLRAYPFAVAGGDASGQWRILVDEVTAREGARSTPLRGANGELSSEAEKRLFALRLFAQSYMRTAELSRAIKDAGLLQPWEFALRFEGSTLGLEGLEILDRDLARRRQTLEALVERFGWDMVRLPAMHDLSLFRMQTLAQAHATDGAPAPPVECDG